MSAARHLSRHLKEVRIHLCQTSSASAGVREYISNNYKVLKSANPEFPILIRECSGIQVIFTMVLSPVMYSVLKPVLNHYLATNNWPL